MDKTDVFTSEDFRAIVGGLYSYAHANNEIASWCFREVRTSGSYGGEMPAFMRLMRNIEELYAWWDKIRAAQNIPTHAEAEAKELQEMYEAYYGTTGS